MLRADTHDEMQANVLRNVSDCDDLLLAELCCQVVGIVRDLAREAPLRSLAVTGGHNLRSQSKNLGQVIISSAESQLGCCLTRPDGADVDARDQHCITCLTMQGVDVVVGTPGRINELMAKGALRLDQCRAVVLDEVDILLGGPTFSSDPGAPLHHASCASRICTMLSFCRHLRHGSTL